MTQEGMKPVRLVDILFPVLWVAMLAAVGISLAFNPNTEPRYSEQENRMLQGLPALTLENTLNGDFSGLYENYLLDNFVLRNEFTGLSKEFMNLFSAASIEDAMLAVDDQDDELTDAITTLPPMPEELDTEPVPTVGEPSVVPDESTLTTEQPEPSIAAVVSADPTPQKTLTPTATPKPVYPSTVGITFLSGGKKVTMRSWNAKNVEYAAQVLNAYAACLKPGGRLCYIMVPSSTRANKFIMNKSASGLMSNVEDCLRANVADTVSVFSMPEVFSEPISRGEAVYFRSDMHWTPLGAHYAYAAMMRRLGLEPIPYDQYEIKREHPFLGTLYRDNPSASMKRNPDTLDLCLPRAWAEFREVTAPGEYRVAPLLNMKAPSNDRYAVYLGNTHSAWSTIVTKAGTGRTALLVKDSFGLCFAPFLIPHYDTIHIVDPRYFKKAVAGGSVKQLMQQYGVDDCFVVLGDLHAYDDSFLMESMLKVLVK